MLDKIFEGLNRLLRPALLDTKIGTHLFNPDKNTYWPLKYGDRKRTVSSIESFVDVILEEAKRRDNKTGEFMTVILNNEGGYFYVDDKDRIQEDLWKFERQTSASYAAFCRGIHQEMNHQKFLRFLQSMKPAIEGYQEVFKAFRRVQLDASSSMASSPIMENGEAGNSLSFQVKAANGTTKNVLPSEIVFAMPVVRGSNVIHTFKAETDVSISQDKKEIVFSLAFPGLELLKEEILSEEKKRVETAVYPTLPDCFIVVDY